MLKITESLNMKKNRKTLLSRIKRLYVKSERFFHLLVGMPSYDKYLEHMRDFHPDIEPKTRAQFFKDAQDSRYNGKTNRCC